MSKYKKQVIIINGQGGCGKDTLMNAVAEKYNVVSISAIDKIKVAAETLGWNGSKDPKDRKFLADLKKLSDDYNGFTMTYIINKFILFIADIKGHNDILFICIREPENIKIASNLINEVLKVKIPGTSVATLLIMRGEHKTYGNSSDDSVDNYDYDYMFDNNAPLEESKEKFISFIENNILVKNEEENNNG